MAVLWKVVVAFLSLLNVVHVNRNKVNASRSGDDCAPCSFIVEKKRVDCSRRNLTKVPPGICWPDAEIIDLSDNKISELPNLAFANFSELQQLHLEENKLKELPHNAFKGLKKLTVLNLKGNLFKTCPDFGQYLESLNELYLTGNKMAFIDENAFEHVSTVKHLWLDHNELTEVPHSALSKLKDLNYLSLDQNKIQKIRNGSFNSLSKLETLLLFYNGVEEIDEEGFKGLTSLELLNLRLNNLTSVPATLKDITKIEQLELDLNPITEIPDLAFKGLNQLRSLSFTWEKLVTVGHSAFAFLPRLQQLTLVNVKLDKFPNLTGTSSLQYLTLTSNRIKELPENLCENQNKLVDLNLNFNRITRIPDLSKCTSLSVLKIEHNKITSIGSSLRGMTKLKDLTLKGNLIEEIPSRTFEGVSQLETLNLANNKIKHIDDDAFEPFKMIRVLDLSDNKVPKLPARGLRTLETVSVRENKELRDFPASKLVNIRHVDAHYPYHCCFFRREKEQVEKKADQENVGGEPKDGWTWEDNAQVTYLINDYERNNTSSHYSEDDLPGFGSGTVDPLLADIEDSSGQEMMSPSQGSGSSYFSNIIPIEDEKYRQVKCTPEPTDPFLPCDDLMDTSLLRFGVWVVFLLALLGNSTVIFVIVTRRSRIDVPRFLICNLAVADLCLGIYLGLLAIVDASTRGNFRNYGVQWQLSHGCKTAGFLAVLSSETSVFTLTVLTIERYIAITHALDITKKMSLKKTAIIMLFGWCFALLAAILPLLDVSDYTKFSVCLPFETGDIKSLTYVTTILILNGSAFLVILTCYLRIYCAIRGSNAWNTNDSRTAQRMALLVFTDFACWAPITVLSLAAAFGGTFVSLKDAKIFTVFVFPLNSCANPFLYAIFTAEFKRDCISFFRRVKTTHIGKLTSSRRRWSLSTGEMRRNSSQVSSSNGLEGVIGKLRARDIRRNSLPPTIKMTSKVSTRGEAENEIVVERETVL